MSNPTFLTEKGVGKMTRNDCGSEKAFSLSRRPSSSNR